MPTPWKHPKTGVFYIRIKVPAPLRGKVGHETHQRTLGTKNATEAKVLFAEALADLNERWARLAAEPGRLTLRQRKALAGEYRRWSIARRQENPGRPDDLRREIDRARFHVSPPGRRLPSPGVVVRDLLDAFLEERRITVHPMDMSDLGIDCANAEIGAKETLLRYAMGDFSQAKDLDRYPEYVPTPSAPAVTRSRSAPSAGGNLLTVAVHWEPFAAEGQYAPGTRKAWKPVLLKFTAFLGRSDLSTATADEIGEWKGKLLNGELSDRKLSKKTVRHTYLTALRTFLQWGVTTGKLKENACANIRVARDRIVQSAPEDGERDLSDAHAYLILSEALRPSDGRTSPLFAAAKRWVPWICAYTGARVNEVTQVRRMDFRREAITQGEAWIMRITPDAGPVKGGKARDVVLHPHLIEQGLVAFVRSCPEGPLFYDPVRRRGGSNLNPPQRKVGDKIGRWVRELGVDDPGVDPNHGWRHRFKTTARRDDVEMNEEVREGMAGHATRTVGMKYGKMPTGRKWKEVCKLPRFEVQPPTGDMPDTAARRKRNADRAATAERAKHRRLPPGGTRRLRERQAGTPSPLTG